MNRSATTNCTPKPSDTPRVDALDYGDQSIFINGDGYGQLWELARALEREMNKYRDTLRSLDAQRHGSPKKETDVGVAVYCEVCGMRKKPIGRSAPMEMALCDHECPGYDLDPKPGQLWPGETPEDFGF